MYKNCNILYYTLLLQIIIYDDNWGKMQIRDEIYFIF